MTARLNDGRLKVLEGRGLHLLAEVGLYRYGSDPENRDSETPVDDHNHALAALRYMVSRLDAWKMARAPTGPGSAAAAGQAAAMLLVTDRW